MTFNRIAVYGHRGWGSSSIVEALISSGALVKVLYRTSSDISNLPVHITKTEVDINDEAALIDALQDIDIVISLVGHEGVQRQHGFVKAIPKTNVKLFSPSDLAGRYDKQGLRISVNKAKDELEKAAKAAGIPTTVILVGNFAEFALNTPGMGVDLADNKITYSGNSADEKLNLCMASSTRKYVARAYASIFATTPIDQLKNRAIALCELAPTGKDIATALKVKYGIAPQTSSHSLEKVNDEVEKGLESGSLFTLAWYCRKIWAAGQQAQMVGSDFWEVDRYEKATLDDLLLGGKLEAYRALPPQVTEYFRQCH
ncbi:actin polymerization protein [Colletotrichum incanum]|uniref:Actin polymerization protein n=1 Tax=Colletotrichum incanum TaxID=1573173 RepID=A0A166M0Y0_COLIC|nr:actin polymerization protein [Colletotrichum incanum]OHW92191.1 NADB-Rossmann family domain-containing protein [Colletotrichum incanum]